ncbi:MAG: NAD(P)/FAD-dependent oxidoreductase [Rhodomicrobium sp.]
MESEAEHFDVLIIGAGLSGIAAAYYLQSRCHDRTFAILEARQALGGTWDLFRYPGIRSDSDLYTFGFSFAPWRNEKAIADGPSILKYLQDTAQKFGIVDKIRFNQKVTRAAWDSGRMRWTLSVTEGAGEALQYTCNFLYLCTGYYDFENGYSPSWPGMEKFGGRIIHPQHWPEDLDYTGRHIAVVGSGATAVTLVPALAEQAAHVTMVQRSPTYIVALPAKDRIANWLRRSLPESAAHGLARWKNILLTMFFYNMARLRPKATKQQILQLAKSQLAPEFDAERHLSPRYNPWDQRLCLIPDGDLFKSIREGRVSIVTGEVASFYDRGVRMASGEEMEADIIITATGLNLKLSGGITVTLDGESFDQSKSYIYKGMMLSGVPNLAYALGYTNASWTLKCELTSRYVCRLLNRMKERGLEVATPRLRESLREEPAIRLTSGYVQRSIAHLPKQGSKMPWKLYQNYALDLLTLKFGPIEDGTIEFSGPTAKSSQKEPGLETVAQ